MSKFHISNVGSIDGVVGSFGSPPRIIETGYKLELFFGLFGKCK